MFEGDLSTASSINAVLCVGGSIESRGGDPVGTLTFVYMNKVTGTSYGTCPFPVAMLSPRSLLALKSFLESAEEDFGQLIFHTGSTSPEEATLELKHAESSTGLGRSR